jgi:hypothetical protein
LDASSSWLMLPISTKNLFPASGYLKSCALAFDSFWQTTQNEQQLPRYWNDPTPQKLVKSLLTWHHPPQLRCKNLLRQQDQQQEKREMYIKPFTRICRRNMKIPPVMETRSSNTKRSGLLPIVIHVSTRNVIVWINVWRSIWIK